MNPTNWYQASGFFPTDFENMGLVKCCQKFSEIFGWKKQDSNHLQIKHLFNISKQNRKKHKNKQILKNI